MPIHPKRTVKTPALRQLQKAFYAAVHGNEKQTDDTVALIEEESINRVTRRKFSGDILKASAALGLAGMYQSCSTVAKKTQPAIAIVGAGIAGLHSAYILKQAGITAQVYEGSGRAGGRIFTVPEMLGPGLWTEMGGEFIDSDHADMFALTKHFNLPLLDREAAGEEGLKEFAYYFDGKHYELKDVLEAVKPAAAQIQKDRALLSDEITYTKYSADDARLDKISTLEYIEQTGISGWFKNFIDAAFTAEYGMDIAEQSCISFLSLFDPGDSKSYKLLGDSDERYSIIGGGQKLMDALAHEIKDQLMKEYLLTAISQNNDKKYMLSFNAGTSKKEDVIADIVLLTIPFATLRNVDIKLPLPSWKTNVINNLGYGTNSKFFVGVNDRVWRKQGYKGYAFSDNGMTNGYDNTAFQNNNTGSGGYTVFLGGKNGLDVCTADAGLMQKKYIAALDAIFPGVSSQFNGKFFSWFWPTYAFSKCSYTSYKVGQYTAMSGAEFQPVDNLYFAGEHCSYAFQGFMNGGAQTGRQAAENIIKKIKG